MPIDDARPADLFLSGDRDGILERARRSAEAFRADPEAERGRRMGEMFAPLPLPTGPGNDGNALWRPAPPVAPPPAPDVPLPPERPQFPPAAPVDHSLDGFVVGSIKPQVDASQVAAAGTAAQDAKGHLEALNVAVAPQVDATSIAAAKSDAQQLLAMLGQIGAAAAAAHAAVASIGAGGGLGARPGPSLASRQRGGFTGNGSAME